MTGDAPGSHPVDQYATEEWDLPEHMGTVLYSDIEKLILPVQEINYRHYHYSPTHTVINDIPITILKAAIYNLTQAPVTSLTKDTFLDCQAGCTGLCYGCTGTCMDGCLGSCKDTCEGECLGCTSCTGTCLDTCTGQCEDTCANTCSRSCKGSCSNDCATGCSKNCTNQCLGCSGTCRGYCQTSCDTSTAWGRANCGGGCWSSCRSGCANFCEGGCCSQCYGGCGVQVYSIASLQQGCITNGWRINWLNYIQK